MSKFKDWYGRTLGQAITFEFQRIDRTQKTVNTTAGMNTIKKIAAKNGGAKNARAIADYNGIVSIVSKMQPGRKIKLPGQIATTTTFVLEVLAGDSPPIVTGGYAKWDVMDRWGRAGLMQFQGYDPISLDIPIRFRYTDKGQSGLEVEDAIQKLEQAAGRGQFPGASIGAPGTVRVYARDELNRNVPLVPRNYSSDPEINKNPLNWVIRDIQWDPNPWRNDQGNRIDQKATVSIQQYTSVNLAGSR